MAEARLVLWVRWRQAKGTVLYWLRLTGFKPEAKGAGERVYLLYLLAAGLVWVGLMWAYAAYQANALGHALPSRIGGGGPRLAAVADARRGGVATGCGAAQLPG